MGADSPTAPVRGLSPPTRGNLPRTRTLAALRRSIPAHAGEPRSAGRSAAERGVYPRPRGGTARTARTSGTSGGLSPPTRGNPPPQPVVGGGIRSIPAHAGEPNTRGSRAPVWAVYPRPRGGTSSIMFGPKMFSGLSPPTRGNRYPVLVRWHYRRSIPAHAGEPRQSRRRGGISWVYPRPRGGTKSSITQAPCERGLSPPTRGNPRYGRGRPDIGGSIPAHAGEPRRSSSSSARRGVYPRPRGGTS